MYDFDDNNSGSNRQGFYSSNAFGSSEIESTSRPTSITVIGVLLIISLVFGLIQLGGALSGSGSLPGWVWLVLLLNYGLFVAAIIGIMSMKKYGAWALLAQTAVSTLFQLIAGAGGTAFMNLIGSVIMLYFVFRKYEDMN